MNSLIGALLWTSALGDSKQSSAAELQTLEHKSPEKAFSFSVVLKIRHKIQNHTVKKRMWWEGDGQTPGDAGLQKRKETPDPLGD